MLGTMMNYQLTLTLLLWRNDPKCNDGVCRRSLDPSNPIVLVGPAKGKHIVRLDLVGDDYKSTGVSQTVAFNVSK